MTDAYLWPYLAPASLLPNHQVSIPLFLPMATVQERLQGGFVDGRPVYAYDLTTPSGQRATVINYGATLTHWARADAHGMHEHFKHPPRAIWTRHQGGAVDIRPGPHLGRHTGEGEGHAYSLPSSREDM